PLTPLYAFDRIKAWKGTPAGLDFPVTVEASAWRGRPTELHTIWPWSTPGRMPAQHYPSVEQILRSLFDTGIQWIVVIFSAFLAWRNFRAGRGDRRVANRLAMLTLVLAALEWVSTAHWIPDTGMLAVIETSVADWLSAAVLIWLLYVGLEPVVRARWPHALVTWSRALAGRWRDPLVASHVLYGALIGVVIGYFFLGMQMYSVLHGIVGGAT